MSEEDYKLIEVKSAEDFFKFVDKYELDLSRYLEQLAQPGDTENT